MIGAFRRLRLRRISGGRGEGLGFCRGERSRSPYAEERENSGGRWVEFSATAEEECGVRKLVGLSR